MFLSKLPTHTIAAAGDVHYCIMFHRVPTLLHQPSHISHTSSADVPEGSPIFCHSSYRHKVHTGAATHSYFITHSPCIYHCCCCHICKDHIGAAATRSLVSCVHPSTLLLACVSPCVISPRHESAPSDSSAKY